jgi:hypothetical protein
VGVPTRCVFAIARRGSVQVRAGRLSGLLTGEAGGAYFCVHGRGVLLQGDVEVLRVAVTIDHPNEVGWTGEQVSGSDRPPKKFVPEPHPLTVKLLEGDGSSGLVAEAMVAVHAGRVHLVGLSVFEGLEEASERQKGRPTRELTGSRVAV